MSHKKPFSAAPFVYVFLQLFLFGICAIKCDTVTDFQNPFTIILWIDVFFTFVFYFFIHLRDPGFVPLDMIQLTDGSSRAPKQNNMISLYSTYRNKPQEEKFQNDFMTRPTPKCTEQDLRREERKQQYFMKHQKMHNQFHSTSQNLQTSQQNNKYATFMDEQQNSQCQIETDIENSKKPKSDVDLQVYIKDTENDEQEKNNNMEIIKERSNEQTINSDLKNSKNNNQDMVNPSDYCSSNTNNNSGINQQQNQIHNMQNIEDNHQQEEEDEEEDDTYEENYIPQCENTIIETESFHQGGLSKLDDSVNESDQQDFEIDFSKINSPKNAKLKQQLFSQGTIKTPEQRSPRNKSGSLKKSIKSAKNSQRIEPKVPAQQKQQSMTAPKQNTEQSGTTTMSNNATTAFTTSIGTKTNQDCLTQNLYDMQTNQEEYKQKQKSQQMIIHIPDDKQNNIKNDQHQLNELKQSQSTDLPSPQAQNYRPSIDSVDIHSHESDKQQDHEQHESQFKQNQLEKFERELNRQAAEVFIEKRYCSQCNVEQPVRSKHCSDCNRCVATYDHHCPWIGTCVGERNRCTFYWYLQFQFIQIVIPLIMSVNCLTNYEGKDFMWDNLLTMFVLFVILCFGIMVGILIIYHTYLMIQNLTTWENVSWFKISYLKDVPEEHGSPFSQGYMKNIKKYCQLRLDTPLINWIYSDKYAQEQQQS